MRCDPDLERVAAALSPDEVPCAKIRLFNRQALRSSVQLAPAYWRLIDIQLDWNVSEPLNAVGRYRVAGKAATELLSLPPREREMAVLCEARYRQRGLALWLLHEEQQMRSFDVLKARDLAETAVLVSRTAARDAGCGTVAGDHCCCRSTPEAELIARSLTRHANSWRVTGDYGKANGLMVDADRWLGSEPSARVLAEYEFFRGPLLMEQGAPAAARQALDNAARLYEAELDDEHMCGAAELTIAKLISDFAQPHEELLQIIEKAIRHINGLRDPALAAAAQLHLASALMNAGDITAAYRTWRVVELFDSPLAELQRLGIGGIIHLKLEDFETAETLLGRVVNESQQLQHDYLSVFAMLHLAIVYIKSSRPLEGQQLLEQVISIYQGNGWHFQDLLAARQILQELRANGASSIPILERVIKALIIRKAEKRPGLPSRLTAQRGRVEAGPNPEV